MRIQIVECVIVVVQFGECFVVADAQKVVVVDACLGIRWSLAGGIKAVQYVFARTRDNLVVEIEYVLKDEPIIARGRSDAPEAILVVLFAPCTISVLFRARIVRYGRIIGGCR